MPAATRPTVFEVPLVSVPQEFKITLSSNQYYLRVTWCWPAVVWILDIYDGDINPILLGIPLVTGANLLEQFRQLGIPGILTVQTDHDTLALPTFDNLGSLSHLYYLPFDQAEAL